ncbi:MAG: energy transducer TonB [Polyangiaceae bacterium]|nr:energy transducer TonB [Polyangiaceae bacterium]
MNRIQIILVGGSLAIHIGVWAWMGALPKERKTSSVAIALAESTPKKKTDDEKPPPPAPAARAEPHEKVAAPAPKPAQQKAEPPPPSAPPPPSVGDAPAAMDGFADLGMAMGSGGSMAVPTGPRLASAQPVDSTVKKAKALAAGAGDECAEDPVKPRLDKQVPPAYSPEARQANVEGVVKLEITVDATGRVIQVRVVKGLGFGLDEAAVTAAKQWSFKPATRCGKAVSYVIKPGVRFQLGS